MWAIAVKEFRQLRRDRRMVALMTRGPVRRALEELPAAGLIIRVPQRPTGNRHHHLAVLEPKLTYYQEPGRYRWVADVVRFTHLHVIARNVALISTL
jgi:hypothetical protein